MATPEIAEQALLQYTGKTFMRPENCPNAAEDMPTMGRALGAEPWPWWLTCEVLLLQVHSRSFAESISRGGPWKRVDSTCVAFEGSFPVFIDEVAISLCDHLPP